MTSQQGNLFTDIKQSVAQGRTATSMHERLIQVLKRYGISESVDNPYVPFTYRPYTQNDMILYGCNGTSLYIDGASQTYSLIFKTLRNDCDRLVIPLGACANDIYVLNIGAGHQMQTVITTGAELLPYDEKQRLRRILQKMHETLEEVQGNDASVRQTSYVHLDSKIAINPSSILSQGTNITEASAQEIFDALQARRQWCA